MTLLLNAKLFVSSVRYVEMDLANTNPNEVYDDMYFPSDFCCKIEISGIFFNSDLS